MNKKELTPSVYSSDEYRFLEKKRRHRQVIFILLLLVSLGFSVAAVWLQSSILGKYTILAICGFICSLEFKHSAALLSKDIGILIDRSIDSSISGLNTKLYNEYNRLFGLHMDLVDKYDVLWDYCEQLRNHVNHTPNSTLQHKN